MEKDLYIATQAAKAAGAPLPMGTLAQQLYSLQAIHGNSKHDFSVIFEFLRGQGGETKK